MGEAARDLVRETEAARVLREQLRDTAGDDADLIRDCIEGETGLHETIEAAAKQIAADTAAVKGIEDFEKTMGERKARLKKRVEALRVLIRVAMETAEIRSKELPFGTFTRSKVAPAAIITDEAEVPSKFWAPQPPKLDKRAVLAALKDGEQVPGATLSNGSETLTIRWS